MLEFGNLDPELVEEFGPLVEELDITGLSVEMKMVCPVSTNDLGLEYLIAYRDS